MPIGGITYVFVMVLPGFCLRLVTIMAAGGHGQFPIGEHSHFSRCCGCP
jgi:hypothetical protein